MITAVSLGCAAWDSILWNCLCAAMLHSFAPDGALAFAALVLHQFHQSENPLICTNDRPFYPTPCHETVYLQMFTYSDRMSSSVSSSQVKIVNKKTNPRKKLKPSCFEMIAISCQCSNSFHLCGWSVCWQKYNGAKNEYGKVSFNNISNSLPKKMKTTRTSI